MTPDPARRPRPDVSWPSGPDPLTAVLGDFDPEVHPPRLAGADVHYRVEETDVGRLLLAARPDGVLLACSYVAAEGDVERMLSRLATTVSPRVLRGGGMLEAVRHELEEYLSGRRKGFDLRVDLALAGPFQREVLTRLASTVEYGHTTSYGAIARAVGKPTAARAVGAALGANPLCVVLPCHRVVAASGALTGYAGGLEVKQRLLDLEATHRG